MIKVLVKQSNKKQTKQMILERLNKELTRHPKKGTGINTLKTQCTLNDKTQETFEKIFQEWDDHLQVKYHPISSGRNKPPLKRSLYLELLELKKPGKLKTQSKEKNHINKRHCLTQVRGSLELGRIQCKNSSKISRQNTYRKGTLKKVKSRIETPLLKNCISPQKKIETLKRSESANLFPLKGIQNAPQRHSKHPNKFSSKMKKKAEYQNQQLTSTLHK